MSRLKNIIDEIVASAPTMQKAIVQTQVAQQGLLTNGKQQENQQRFIGIPEQPKRGFFADVGEYLAR